MVLILIRPKSSERFKHTYLHFYSSPTVLIEFKTRGGNWRKNTKN